MATLAKVLLWFGVLLMVFSVLTFATLHRVAGNVADEKMRAVHECRDRQAVLKDVDRSVWTDAQRKAFDNICAVRPVTPGLFDVEPPFILIVLSLVLGSALYLADGIRSGRKQRGVASNNPPPPP